MNRVFALMVLVGLVLMLGVAFAAPGPVGEDTAEERAATAQAEPAGAAGQVFKDLLERDWRQAASGFVWLTMGVLARFRGRIPWFRGDRGGALLLLLVALLGGAGTALAAEASILSAWFLLGSLWTAVGAAGLHAITTRLLWPKDGKQYLVWLKVVLAPVPKPAATGEVSTGP